MGLNSQSTGKLNERSGRRFSIIERLKNVHKGIFRRASTSNSAGTDLAYDPAIQRKMSLQVHNNDDKRLHTSQAHLSFATLSPTQVL